MMRILECKDLAPIEVGHARAIPNPGSVTMPWNTEGDLLSITAANFSREELWPGFRGGPE